MTTNYLIIGICGIFTRSSPVRYQITDATVDADLFLLEIEATIANIYLWVGNILILDNIANTRGKATVLKEWLWEEHMVLVLFLPARVPGWYPIKLMWNCLAQRLSISGNSRLP